MENLLPVFQSKAGTVVYYVDNTGGIEFKIDGSETREELHELIKADMKKPHNIVAYGQMASVEWLLRNGTQVN